MSVPAQLFEPIVQSIEASRGRTPINLNSSEQVLSVAAGAMLGINGLLTRGPAGLLATGLAAGLLYRGLTGHCPLYDQLGIDSSRKNLSTVIPARQGVHVKKTVLIATPAEDLFNFWDDVENLPSFMRHIANVTKTGEATSHWIAEGPLGVTVEWDAEIDRRVPNQLIAWRSLPDSAVQTAGSIRFEEQSNYRGTAVTLTMKYNPPGGKLTDSIAWLFGRDLTSEIDHDLRNFKRIMEAGELPTVEGQSHGPRGIFR